MEKLLQPTSCELEPQMFNKHESLERLLNLDDASKIIKNRRMKISSELEDGEMEIKRSKYELTQNEEFENKDIHYEVDPKEQAESKELIEGALALDFFRHHQLFYSSDEVQAAAGLVMLQDSMGLSQEGIHKTDSPQQIPERKDVDPKPKKKRRRKWKAHYF